jgi:hypothetical protein
MGKLSVIRQEKVRLAHKISDRVAQTTQLDLSLQSASCRDERIGTIRMVCQVKKLAKAFDKASPVLRI